MSPKPDPDPSADPAANLEDAFDSGAAPLDPGEGAGFDPGELNRVQLDRQTLLNRELLRQVDLSRFRRLGSVSGTYEGPRIVPSGGEELVLRVDIDSRGAHSPVLNRLSGDFFKVHEMHWGRRKFSWKSYTSSWVVHNPNVTWEAQAVKVTGLVRYWEGTSPFETVTVRIPWEGGKMAGPAEATFRTRLTRAIRTFRCPRTSSAFRQLRMEVDVCASVNAEPILPVYDTHAHATRPGGLVQRDMTVASAYREAGVEVTLAPERTIIDDSASQFNTWSNAELHDAMETHFSRYASGGAWPKWDMWGVLCGRHDNSGLAGIMFDYSATGEPPERQGFALFRNHSWFNNVPSGAPTNQAQAAALRNYLYTWIHEAGHGFNFVHSWNKDRADALSWMNYPHYVTNFWNNFMLEFDEEELLHLRHGNRASVIPGGDAWATGLHLHSGGEGTAMLPAEGEMPLELLVRSSGHFEFLEPVEVELRLRNTAPFPLEVLADLRPEGGAVSIQVRKPSGAVTHYEPLTCEIAPMETRTLEPQGSEAGTDRYSQTLPLAFGKGGFVFSEPGEYRVRAVYHDPTGVSIPSPAHRIRIGQPVNREHDRLASDVFERSVGLALYLDGSEAPALKSGMDTLREVADRFKESMVGVQAALTVAKSEARSHFRFDDPEKPVLKESHKPDPEEVLRVTDAAAKLLKGSSDRAANLIHHELVRDRAVAQAAAGRAGEGRKELRAMKKVLASRGVNTPVLDMVERFAKSLK
jgi:hypothetical protein